MDAELTKAIEIRPYERSREEDEDNHDEEEEGEEQDVEEEGEEEEEEEANREGKPRSETGCEKKSRLLPLSVSVFCQVGNPDGHFCPWTNDRVNFSKSLF